MLCTADISQTAPSIKKQDGTASAILILPMNRLSRL